MQSRLKCCQSVILEHVKESLSSDVSLEGPCFRRRDREQYSRFCRRCLALGTKALHLHKAMSDHSMDTEARVDLSGYHAEIALWSAEAYAQD